jgi:hypothetical protein
MATQFMIQLARGLSHLCSSLQLQVQVSCAALLLLTPLLSVSPETVAFSLMLSKMLKTGLLILLQLMSHELLMLFHQLS